MPTGTSTFLKSNRKQFYNLLDLFRLVSFPHFLGILLYFWYKRKQVKNTGHFCYFLEFCHIGHLVCNMQLLKEAF